MEEVLSCNWLYRGPILDRRVPCGLDSVERSPLQLTAAKRSADTPGTDKDDDARRLMRTRAANRANQQATSIEPGDVV